MMPLPRNHDAICVIPARGGSKRIPGKNIKLFCGKPMMQWAIESAKNSACFAKVVVSTDCPEIAAVARECGAEVPFMRPESLSDDYTVSFAVIRHAIGVLSEQAGADLEPETAICCLYSTSPFVRALDFGKSRELLTSTNFVIPVTSFAFPIQRACRMDSNGTLNMFSAEHFATRSQDLEEAWHDTGQFYWATVSTWRCDSSPYEQGAVAYPIPRWRVQDIDTMEDWRRAELLFQVIDTD